MRSESSSTRILALPMPSGTPTGTATIIALVVAEKQCRRMTRICHPDFTTFVVDDADEDGRKVSIRTDTDLSRRHLKISRGTITNRPHTPESCNEVPP